jgi:hypothetical protein
MRQRIWLAVLALAACGSEVEQTAEPSADQVEPALAPSPPASKPVVAPLLTAEGYGPLRIGMSLAAVEEALGPDVSPEEPGGPDPQSCDIFHPARAPDGMLVMIEDGRLTRVSLVDGSAVKTTHGLGLGDAAATVRARLDNRVQASPHEYLAPAGAYLTIWEGSRRAERDVQDPAARGIRYEIGLDNQVETIHAGGPAIQYVEGCL